MAANVSQTLLANATIATNQSIYSNSSDPNILLDKLNNINASDYILPSSLLDGSQQLVNETLSIFTDQVPQTKLLASLILFIVTLLCGYLPVRILLNQNYIQYAMFAGGGVLMATAFCHLIPEAHDNYKLSGLPNPQAVLNVVGQLGGHEHETIATTSTTTTTTTIAPSTTTSPDASGGAHEHHHHHHADDPLAPGGLNIPFLEVTLCCGFFFMYLAEILMVRFINNHTHEHPCDTSSGHLVGSISVDSHANPEGLAAGGSTGSTSNGSTIGANATNLSSTRIVGGSTGSSELYKFVRGLLIVSAFGAHSIFDGVAIGSQESVEKVWTIFIAISCHKLIIAAVVGLELYAATLESHLWTLVHLCIFSIMSPIGIILIVVAQNSLHLDSNHPSMILLQSFATGTLLYIVFVEILQPKEDQTYEKNRIGKSLSLIAGFALMLLVLTLIDE